MTLIEIVLALGLSVLIFAAIATGIYIYLNTLTQQQSELEQQQVVRSVVQMISNDVRAAMQYKPADVSGLSNLSLTEALMGGMGGLLGGSGGRDSGDGSGGTGGMDSGSDAGVGGGSSGGTGAPSGSDGTSEEDTATFRPMLIGNSQLMSIDISRLPRVDQYHSLMVGNDPGNQTPSDLKSVMYMLGQPGNQTGASQEFDPEIAALGGLYRRQIDRAVAAFRGEYGPTGSIDEYCQLIAPEIVQLEFRYFDGSNWQSDWNSENQGGFPLAIEVTLGFDTQRLIERSRQDRQNAAPAMADMGRIRLYRQVVHLPLSEIMQ
ncbi:MAG TPA: hypothetical protein PKD54_13295 [Pirellulaceae bacterium]|nr:hypothetical protein [Pirellulaceae bacterium]